METDNFGGIRVVQIVWPGQDAVENVLVAFELDRLSVVPVGERLRVSGDLRDEHLAVRCDPECAERALAGQGHAAPVAGVGAAQEATGGLGVSMRATDGEIAIVDADVDRYDLSSLVQLDSGTSATPIELLHALIDFNFHIPSNLATAAVIAIDDDVAVQQVDYDKLRARLLAQGQVLAPLDHPDPAHLLVTGTGLSHLGSADARDEMHRKLSADEEAALSDSMKMFRMGLEGGKPAPGETGGSWAGSPTSTRR